MENLGIYNQCREVPQHAQRSIQDGKLKGKTDINPMWRIQKLTEMFGPCGFGWFVTDVEQWREECKVITRDGVEVSEVTVHVKLALIVKLDGKWSEKIIGYGGSKMAGKGQGDQANDECFKMAYTDAISVACKMLGMGADVYWQADSTKYTQGAPVQQQAAPAPAPAQPAQQTGEADIQLSLDLIAAINECKSMEELTTLHDNQLEPLRSSKKLAALFNARYKAINTQK